ncbi:MAG: mannose-6-phosphate isomerase, class I, partial [Candidatus Syntrophosphaera sp.]|nr:mannose-6-phosphate isomerase, class I [Candidatus Syntrophosphaera sp.]
MPVFRLSNPLKYYTWGSLEFIPRFLDQVPATGKPVAEMWMGAHPLGSSQIWVQDTQISLRDYVQLHSNQALGRAAKLSDSGFPFLLKVLAAAKPLSIQAHPSLEQAREGFERENQLGVLPNSHLRNYKDPNHKPELICALTPFKALCGFRSYSETVGNFRRLGLDRWFNSFADLAANLDQSSFRSFFRELMATSGERKQAVLDRLSSSLEEDNGLDEALRKAILALRGAYPEDIGILSPLYLNLFHLRPGEALYLVAGVLHSYLEGAGIEIMASSDNVLRGGLTS